MGLEKLKAKASFKIPVKMCFVHPPLPISYVHNKNHRRRLHSRTKTITASSVGDDHLPPHAYTKLTVEGTPVCRLITSLQTSSSSPLRLRFISDLVEAGFTTFDIQSTTSISASALRSYIDISSPSTIRSLDLCVHLHINPCTMPDKINAKTITKLVDAQLNLTGVERIHLLQLTWYDLKDKRYIDVLGELQELKQKGKLRSMGTVNFPTLNIKHILSQDIEIASNQIPLSLIDRRAIDGQMSSNNISLLGNSPNINGFINERFLGMPEPSRKVCIQNAIVGHLVHKIRLWGGWSLFQELLYSVHVISRKYGVTMVNVAITWALQQPSFESVVIDACLSDDHIYTQQQQHPYLQGIQAFQFSLDEEDMYMLEAVMKKGNDLHPILGDCGHEFQPYSRFPS